MGNVNMAAAVPQNLACGCCWWTLCNCSHAFNPLCVLIYLAPVHSCVTAIAAQPSTPGSMSLFHTNFRVMFYSACPAVVSIQEGQLPHCLLLFSTHCITSLKPFTTLLFTGLISPLEQFNLVLGSGALRDKVFKAEAMRCAIYVIHYYSLFALSKI